MLTVRELISQLAEMPQDAPVFVHAGGDVDGDDIVSGVVLCDRGSIRGPFYQMKQYYCNGDSVAALYMLDHPDLQKVVVIGNGLYE